LVDEAHAAFAQFGEDDETTESIRHHGCIGRPIPRRNLLGDLPLIDHSWPVESSS
jgi:hypothetical protein